MGTGAARRMWSLFEPIHDVAYFTPEVQQAADAAGMRGFWMGYFAIRLAPLGRVGAEVATAVCHGFHPARVRRALPDAWDRATPAEVLAARLRGVDAALRRIWGTAVVESETVHEAADLAWAAAVGADCAGRPLGAANQGLPRPEKSHLALWQATTTLREHRGDGHIAVLVTHQVGPVAAHLLKAAADESDLETVRIGRQWPEQDWTAAADSLVSRGILDPDRRPAAAGRDLHRRIEAETDAAAEQPWQALGEGGTRRLAELLVGLARTLVDAGVPPMPNAVGLVVEPAPTD